MSKENKSTKIENERRVAIILDLLARGQTRRKILKYVEDKTDWSVKPRQVDEYIKKAHEETRAAFEQSRDNLVASQVAKYDFIYAKLIGLRDYRGAIAPLDKISELAGLKVIKAEISGFELIVRNESDRPKKTDETNPGNNDEQ